MSCLYKFLDEKTYELLKNKHVLSLSRPILSGILSEGNGLKFLRDICNEIERDKYYVSSNLWREDKELNKKVDEWIQSYRKSIREEYGEDYSDADILSDLQIMLTQYFQIYCGYFTMVDLENPTERKRYCEENTKITEGRCLVKIQLDSVFLDEKLTGIKCGDDLVFYCSSDARLITNNERIEAWLHSHRVEYNGSNSLAYSLKCFNGVDKRKLSSFLQYVKSSYIRQEEERLMLQLPGIHPGEHLTAFQTRFVPGLANSFEERLKYEIVNICQKALEYPKYVYLYTEKFEVLDL